MIASISFLLIFLASYCNADVPKHIDLEFDDDTYNYYSEIPKLDDKNVFGPNAARDFYIVVISGLVTFLLNLFGSLYVIYRTFLQMRHGGRNNVPLSLRFPFYIALTDALLSLSFTINLSYTLVRKLPWANPECKIIGASVTTFFMLNIFLVGIIALTTYSYVCREYYVEFGPYDYKLWFVALALSVVAMTLSFSQSGQQKYWCAGRHHSDLVPIAMIVFIVVVLMTILTCYIKVLLKIRKNDNVLISSYQRPIERRALRKLISYIFTFTLQFIPLLTYYFFSLASIENVFLDVLAVTAINFGGIGNFIQFAINEGLWNTNMSDTPISSMEQNVRSRNSVIPKPDASIAAHEIEVHTIVNINNYYDVPTYNSDYNNDLEEESNEDVAEINDNTNYMSDNNDDDSDNADDENDDNDDNDDNALTASSSNTSSSNHGREYVEGIAH